MEGDSGGAAVSLSHAYQNHSLTSSGARPERSEPERSEPERSEREPSPATHAILTQLKVGERSLETVFRRFPVAYS